MKLPKLKETTKDKIAVGGLTFIASLFIVPYLIGNIALAYDNYILNQMETALKNNVSSAKTTVAACEANYQALLRYKQDNKMPLTGTGDPCSF